ncbi:MAG: hypothetical protein HY070_03795 [Chloroflexi bacterium]|nr:hypothetical protein [Chloroflexota bacterium]MBI3742302.1 hypothetical protein [Chloroflexota bacterium]
MSNWFTMNFPPSRHAIENELRLALWSTGFSQVWITCTKAESPFECQGLWHDQSFQVEWEPRQYVLLKMPEPNQNVLEAFEKILKHRALAAYKQDGAVVVEWRARDADRRYAELANAGANELQRLNA